MAIKSMACEDEEFFRTFIPFFKFETNMGELTGKELLTHTEPVSYALDMNQFHRTSALMLSQNQLLVNACYVYDAQLLRMMQEYDSSFVAYPLEYATFEEFLSEPPAEAFRKAKRLNCFSLHRKHCRPFGCNAELKAFLRHSSQFSIFLMKMPESSEKSSIPEKMQAICSSPCWMLSLKKSKTAVPRSF